MESFNFELNQVIARTLAEGGFASEKEATREISLKEDVDRLVGATVIRAIKGRKFPFVYLAKHVLVVDRRPALL